MLAGPGGDAFSVLGGVAPRPRPHPASARAACGLSLAKTRSGVCATQGWLDDAGGRFEQECWCRLSPQPSRALQHGFSRPAHPRRYRMGHKPLELPSPLGDRTTDPRTHSPWVADDVTPRELAPRAGFETSDPRIN